jgi:predicted nucleic acid-binding Zn ribbon protein
MPPEICPNCGTELPTRVRVCPHCGSDEKTGWADDAHVGGLDLPEDEFNYEEFVENEFGRVRVKRRGLHWFWWLVALLLLIAVVLVCT